MDTGSGVSNFCLSWCDNALVQFSYWRSVVDLALNRLSFASVLMVKHGLSFCFGWLSVDNLLLLLVIKLFVEFVDWCYLNWNFLTVLWF